MALFEQSSERREREREMRAAGWLPPGQSLPLKWPVLHEGSVPRFDPLTWDFRLFGLVDEPLRLSWQEFSDLPQSEVLADMHCVTRWSKFDNRWGGVLATEVVRRVKIRPGARHVMVHADQNYTSNLLLVDFLRPTTILAVRHDGDPLAPHHAYPLPLLFPHPYSPTTLNWLPAFPFPAQQ